MPPEPIGETLGEAPCLALAPIDEGCGGWPNRSIGSATLVLVDGVYSVVLDLGGGLAARSAVEPSTAKLLRIGTFRVDMWAARLAADFFAVYLKGADYREHTCLLKPSTGRSRWWTDAEVVAVNGPFAALVLREKTTIFAEIDALLRGEHDEEHRTWHGKWHGKWYGERHGDYRVPPAAQGWPVAGTSDILALPCPRISNYHFLWCADSREICALGVVSVDCIGDGFRLGVVRAILEDGTALKAGETVPAGRVVRFEVEEELRHLEPQLQDSLAVATLFWLGRGTAAFYIPPENWSKPIRRAPSVLARRFGRKISEDVLLAEPVLQYRGYGEDLSGRFPLVLGGHSRCSEPPGSRDGSQFAAVAASAGGFALILWDERVFARVEVDAAVAAPLAAGLLCMQPAVRLTESCYEFRLTDTTCELRTAHVCWLDAEAGRARWWAAGPGEPTVLATNSSRVALNLGRRLVTAEAAALIRGDEPVDCGEAWFRRGLPVAFSDVFLFPPGYDGLDFWLCCSPEGKRRLKEDTLRVARPVGIDGAPLASGILVPAGRVAVPRELEAAVSGAVLVKLYSRDQLVVYRPVE